MHGLAAMTTAGRVRRCVFSPAAARASLRKAAQAEPLLRCKSCLQLRGVAWTCSAEGCQRAHGFCLLVGNSRAHAAL